MARADEQRRAAVQSNDVDERVGEAVEAYLELAERGDAPDADSFADRYPDDVKSEVRAALDGLELVRGLVGEPSKPGQGPAGGLAAGHRVAGYRIVRELGRGGMGVVYEAVHVDLDRPVALKVLNTYVTPDSRGRKRFLNEAKTAAALHHTHIVPVFDVGQVGGLCYYAMQRIEGVGLDRLLRALRRERTVGAGSSSSLGGRTRTVDATWVDQSGATSITALPLDGSYAGEASVTGSWPRHAGHRPAREEGPGPSALPPRGSEYYRWVADLGQQAAEALAFAHGRGVVHRDIKPSNLLLDAKGQIWVADFGLARRLTDPSQTHVESLLGTPRYMSPEQAEGRPVDARTDLYSLGATLYELLALHPPFDGQTTPELVRQITGREPTPLRQLDARVPRDLETIVLKAMARREADRYESADELADDLGRFLGFEPVKARRIGPLGRLWRLTRRHPALVGVSTAAVATILTVATVAYARVRGERDRAVAAEHQLAQSLEDEKKARRASQEARSNELLSQAALLRVSALPNRRERGRELLRTAALLAPAPDTRRALRDEALELLVRRDIEARTTLPTGVLQGLGLCRATAAQDGTPNLAALADDGRALVLWDPRGGRAPTVKRLAGSEANENVADTAGPPAPGGGPGRGRPQMPWWLLGRPRLATLSSGLVVGDPTGAGFRIMRAASDPVAAPEFTDSRLLGLAGAERGDVFVTFEIERGPDGPGMGRGRPDELRNTTGFTVRLWDFNDLEHPVTLLGEGAVDARAGEPSSGESSSTGGGPGRSFVLPLASVDPEGRLVVTGWTGESRLTVWDAGNPQPLGTIDTDTSVTTIALGPDGLLAAAGDGQVKLWSVQSLPKFEATPLPSLTEHRGLVRQMRFSPDGRLLALAGLTTGLELWNPAANSLVATLPTGDRVGEITFVDDRTLAASAGSTTSVWELVDPIGRVRFEFDEQPLGLTFRSDGLLAIALQEAAPRLWQPHLEPTKVHAWEAIRPQGLAFDGEDRLVAATPDGLTLFAEPLKPPVATMKFPVPEREGLRVVRLLAQTPNGQTQLWSRSGDPRERRGPSGPAELLLWSGRSPEQVRELKPGDAIEGSNRGRGRDQGRSGPQRRPGGDRLVIGPGRAALSPEGDRIYLAANGQVRVWLIEGDALRYERSIDVPEPLTLATSGDGKTLAVGRSDGGLTLVDLSTGARRNCIDPSPRSAADEGFTAAGAPVTGLAFSSDGLTLASGDSQGRLELWSLKGTAPRRFLRLPGVRGAVAVLAFDPSGQQLAVADFTFSERRVVEVWDLGTLRSELSALGLWEGDPTTSSSSVAAVSDGTKSRAEP